MAFVVSGAALIPSATLLSVVEFAMSWEALMSVVLVADSIL